MRQQVKHPMGALREMAQFSRKLLCFSDGEMMVMRMPCDIDQVKDFCNVIWRYTDCEIIRIDYKPKHPLFWGND